MFSALPAKGGQAPSAATTGGKEGVSSDGYLLEERGAQAAERENRKLESRKWNSPHKVALCLDTDDQYTLNYPVSNF